MKYGYTKQVSLSFKDSVEKTKEELKKAGFGVLTEIDVKSTLKEKIGVEFNDYIILGACNPKFAYEALKIEIEIGLLLPCNVIIYEKGEDIFVSSIVPSVAMNMVDNDKLPSIAKNVEGLLKNVIDSI